MASVTRELAELALRIEDVELEQRELRVSPEFRRVTTTVRLRALTDAEIEKVLK